jgi:transcriptional regulator with XRE-family HTH domain
MQTDIITIRKIGEIIKNRRKELGLSQEQLAERVGVSYQQIQRYENGGSMLNVENIQRVAKALGIPVTLFFDPSGSSSLVSEASTPYESDEEKKLLRSFRDLENRPDRTMAVNIIRRLAKK